MRNFGERDAAGWLLNASGHSVIVFTSTEDLAFVMNAVAFAAFTHGLYAKIVTFVQADPRKGDLVRKRPGFLTEKRL